MPSITAYTASNYGGTAYPLDAGRHLINPVDIKSIRVPLGWSATLFSSPRPDAERASYVNDTSAVNLAFPVRRVIVSANAVFHQLNAQHSLKSLDVYDASIQDAPVIQYDWKSQDNQKFMFVRDDDGFYVICVKHTGKVLDVALRPYLERFDRGQVIQHSPNGQDNQKFRLVPVDGVWRVDAKHSGEAWDIRGGSMRNKAELVEHRWTSGANQKFSLVTTESDSLPVQQAREANAIQDPPDLNSFVVPPDEGPETLIGESWVPYFLINDGQRSEAAKIRESPFYRISRFGFWKLLYFIDVPSGADYKKVVTYEEGLTEGDTKAIEETLAITIGTEFQWSIAKKLGFEKFTGSITRTTKITIENSVQRATKTTSQEEISFKSGPRTVHCAWGRGDRFKLSRMDGSELLRWELINSSYAKRLDRFPAE